MSRLYTSNEALGFSSPGNSGISEDMQEFGRPHEVKYNENSHQIHHFSEKVRLSVDIDPLFSSHARSSAASQPGDTGGDQSISDLSRKLAQEDPSIDTGREQQQQQHQQQQQQQQQQQEEGKSDQERDPKPLHPDEIASERDNQTNVGNKDSGRGATTPGIDYSR